MNKNTLKKVGEWAHSRVASGEEPPWTFHKLKLLAELATELAEGFDSNASYTPGMIDDQNNNVDSQKSAENIVEISSFQTTETEPFANLPS